MTLFAEPSSRAVEHEQMVCRSVTSLSQFEQLLHEIMALPPHVLRLGATPPNNATKSVNPDALPAFMQLPSPLTSGCSMGSAGGEATPPALNAPHDCHWGPGPPAPFEPRKRSTSRTPNRPHNI